MIGVRNIGNYTYVSEPEIFKGLKANEKEMIAEFLEEMELDHKDIEDVAITTYALLVSLKDGREYYIVENEDVAQTWAYDTLIEDDYLWKEAVNEDATTQGLEEWADSVIGIDGWESVLSSYNGNYDITDSDYIYFRNN